MPSPHSLRRLANLTTKVRNDLRRGGMGVSFKYLFRSTAILARIVEVLADHMATEAEEAERAALEAAKAEGSASTPPSGGESTESPRRSRESTTP